MSLALMMLACVHIRLAVEDLFTKRGECLCRVSAERAVGFRVGFAVGGGVNVHVGPDV
jgi:hypothetical protein